MGGKYEKEEYTFIYTYMKIYNYTNTKLIAKQLHSTILSISDPIMDCIALKHKRKINVFGRLHVAYL